jgi:hypothetical protein
MPPRVSLIGWSAKPVTHIPTRRELDDKRKGGRTPRSDDEAVHGRDGASGTLPVAVSLNASVGKPARLLARSAFVMWREGSSGASLCSPLFPLMTPRP